MTIDERLDRIDRSLKTLTEYVLDLRQETANRLQTIDNRLDIVSSTLANVDSRLPALTKAVLDFGSISAGLMREQSKQKDAGTALAARVEKLEDLVSRLVEPAA
jgi:DNA repair ATPase RecN